MSYLKLFTNCVPVRGALNFVIYDLQRGKLFYIPEGLFEILTSNDEKGTIAEIKQKYNNFYDEIIDEYVDFLIENELVFFTNSPKSFPEINFSDHDSPELINNCIIDINKNSNHNFSKIMKELNVLKCRHVEFRIFDHISYEEIIAILNLFEPSTLRSIHLYVRYSAEFQSIVIQQKILSATKRLQYVVVHSSPSIYSSFDPSIIFTQEVINDASHCGVVHHSYFDVNLEFFTEAKTKNSCLNKKISIDVDGNIKNCPSQSMSYGNHSEVSFMDVLFSGINDFKDVWSVTKDQIDICNVCEFRYMCSDCRIYTENVADSYSKPSKCNYNPYTGLWKD